MNGNLSRAKGGGKLSKYLFDEKKREPGREQENPIFHTNMAGQTPEELTEELRFGADLNRRTDRTVTHLSISFSPGEQPDLETKKRVVDRTLTLLNYKDPRNRENDCMYFALEHFDKQGKRDVRHIHIVASTIRPDGSRVNDSLERVRLKQAERIVELELGLKYCPPRSKGEQRNLTTGEARQEERTGQPCLKRQLWNAIDRATADRPTMPIALMRVKAEGYDVRISDHEDGKKGISFGQGELHFRGRQLGHSFSFGGLQKYKGVSYQPERDDLRLREINVLDQTQCQRYLARIEQEKSKRNRQQQQESRWLFSDIKPIVPQFSPQLEAQPEPNRSALQSKELRRQLQEFETLTRQLIESEPRPLPGSIEWNRAQFVLEYSRSTMESNREHWAENDRYWCERDPASGEVLVGRKADNQIIAQGKLGTTGWDINTAKVNLSDWEAFIQSQQQQTELEQNQEQNQTNQSHPQTQSKQPDRDGIQR